MAKCHAFPSSFSGNGETPFARQIILGQWQNAIRCPSQFLLVAKCHTLASSFSASGKTPFIAQAIFGKWQDATRSQTQFQLVAKRHELPKSISACGKKISFAIFASLNSAEMPQRLFTHFQSKSKKTTAEGLSPSLFCRFFQEPRAQALCSRAC